MLMYLKDLLNVIKELNGNIALLCSNLKELDKSLIEIGQK